MTDDIDIDTDANISSRIRLLKGPPFSFEFRQILGRFKWTEFKDVFRSDFISSEPTPYRVIHDSEDTEPAGPHKPWPWISKKSAASYATPEATGHTPMFEEAWNPYDSALQSQTRPQDTSHVPAQPSNKISDWSQPLTPSSPSQVPQVQFENQESMPTTTAVEEALIRATFERLQQSPKALDFGVVKQRVEQELGLSPAFWDDEVWFLRSKNIIKYTVVSVNTLLVHMTHHYFAGVLFLSLSLCSPVPPLNYGKTYSLANKMFPHHRRTGSSVQTIPHQRMRPGCCGISHLECHRRLS